MLFLINLPTRMLALLVIAFMFAARVKGLAVPYSDDLAKRSANFVKLDFDVFTKPSVNNVTVTKRDVTDFPLDLVYNQIYYAADIYVGSDLQHSQVLVDTGSADLWIPTPNVTCSSSDGQCTENGSFDPSSSTTWKDLHEEFFIRYGDNSTATGTFGLDTVALSSSGSPALKDFQFASANTSVGDYSILGIGLAASEAETVYFHDPEYANFPVALKNQGFIDKVAYSLYLEADGGQGTVLFGAKDEAKYSGELVTLDIDSDFRLSVPVDEVTYTGVNLGSLTGAVLDTGTPISRLPSSIVSSIAEQLGAYPVTQESITIYILACPGGETDSGALDFEFKNTTISIPPSDLILPANDFYCYLSLIPNDNYTILGDNFLRHAYIVYDLEDKKISLAPAVNTTDSNIVSL